VDDCGVCLDNIAISGLLRAPRASSPCHTSQRRSGPPSSSDRSKHLHRDLPFSATASKWWPDVLQRFCLGFERSGQLREKRCCFATKAVRASQSKDKFTELREPGALIGWPRYCGTARLIRQQNQMVMQEGNNDRDAISSLSGLSSSVGNKPWHHHTICKLAGRHADFQNASS
jgi:hypothetical protein